MVSQLEAVYVFEQVHHLSPLLRAVHMSPIFSAATTCPTSPSSIPRPGPSSNPCASTASSPTQAAHPCRQPCSPHCWNAGTPASQRLQQNHPKSVHVALPTQPPVERVLWRQVPHAASKAGVNARAAAHPHFPRQSKVDNLRLSNQLHQNIGRLEFAVDDDHYRLRVKVLQPPSRAYQQAVPITPLPKSSIGSEGKKEGL